MNYNKTKIYKIWSPKGDKIYIGSTCKDRLCQRMNAHRNRYIQYKKGNEQILTTSFLLFDEYGVENCFIELIESKECSNKDERNQLEGHYIRTLDCVNKVIVGRTKKEWNTYNKDKIKEYYQNNKKSYCIKYKKYREDNKEDIKEYQNKYREDNQDIIKEYQKIYRENNKEKRKEKQKEKIICDCGSEICKVDIYRHNRTKKHINFINNK